MEKEEYTEEEFVGFERKVDEILEHILMEDTPENLALKKSLVDNPPRLEDSLDLLSLSSKYLLLDLEATRRENKTLKKLLRERKE